jgi:hypothetical protein
MGGFFSFEPVGFIAPARFGRQLILSPMNDGPQVAFNKK